MYRAVSIKFTFFKNCYHYILKSTLLIYHIVNKLFANILNLNLIIFKEFVQNVVIKLFNKFFFIIGEYYKLNKTVIDFFLCLY